MLYVSYTCMVYIYAKYFLPQVMCVTLNSHYAMFNRPCLFSADIRILYTLVIPYIGNCPWKKKYANFANLEAFVNVFLHFLSQLEFLYMGLPESQKSFLANYGKEGNSQNFSYTDDSRYTVVVFYV